MILAFHTFALNLVVSAYVVIFANLSRPKEGRDAVPDHGLHPLPVRTASRWAP